jgi:hypothetical protein
VLEGLPAQVPLTIRLDADTRNFGTLLASDVVLKSGETRDVVLPGSTSKLPEGAVESEVWIPVDPVGTSAPGMPSALIEFEILNGARWIRHTNVGGRSHVHHVRACPHLEAVPGNHTIIARDANGWIGIGRFDVRASNSRATPSVSLAPGALLRMTFDGPEDHARIALESKGIEFAARELPRGVVWYELVPAGSVTVRIAGDTTEPRTLALEATAGQILPVALDRSPR